MYINGYRAFSLTWSVAMQIIATKESFYIRKRFYSHRVWNGLEHTNIADMTSRKTPAVFAIYTSPTIHLVCHPNILHNLCF